MLARIRQWRDICPDITLRSTFIVGFPGETEDDFERLLDFLGEAELDRVGCFPYSPVEGAAANELPDHVPEEIRQERWERLMAVQAGISAKRLKRFVGRTIPVLIDEVDASGILIGRSVADAPGIDGVVRVTDQNGIQAGELIDVLVTDASDYDLEGRALPLSRVMA
jgi:ribosomal protein S12 methylthiotransferase